MLSAVRHAPVVDLDAVPSVHRAPGARDLLPQVHRVESLGPTRRDDRGQARKRASCALEHCRIGWEQQLVICPAGRIGSS